MAISSDKNKQIWQGDGSTTVFDISVDIVIYDVSHIKLYIFNETEGTTTLLESGYSIDLSDYQVTLSEPPSENERLILLRSVPLVQEKQYPEFDPFPSKSHERGLDYLTMITQQLREEIDRSIRADLSFTDDLTLPPALADAYLGWDSEGEKIVNKELPDPSILEKASQEDAEAGTNNDKFMTPLRTKQAIDELSPALEKATGADIDTGTNDTKYVTPKAIGDSNVPNAKATGADIDTGTDDAKFVTAKAIAESELSDDSFEVYDSGWFAVSTANQYTKKHDLGTRVLMASIYVDSSNDDSNFWKAEFFWQTNTNGGEHTRNPILQVVDDDNVKLFIPSSQIGSAMNTSGGKVDISSGYARIILIGL